MKYQLIPLIASLLLGASSFLLGMSLEDTQGRTLEATDVSIAGQSVTFTRADTGQVFTVPVDTFSNKTLEKISKIEQVEPLQDSTPVPEIGINILDNEGRTINATDFKVEGDSVSFTMVKTEREFTIALSTLSDKSQKEIKELIERNQEESFQAILPDPESTQGYQPTEDIRVLDVTKNEIVYEIPERIQTRQGKPIDIIKASEISTLYGDYQGERRMGYYSPYEGETETRDGKPIWFSLKNGEKLRFIGPEEYEISISSQGPLTVVKSDFNPKWEAHIKAYQLRESELQKALKNTVHLEDFNQYFNQWIIDWYVENFFRHPEMPMALVNQLLGDPELRIEYIDAVTFEKELENRKVIIAPWTKHRAHHLPATADDIHKSRRILSEIAREFPEQIKDNTRLALALSLIHDLEASYNTKTFQELKYAPPQKAFLRSYIEVFEWKTEPSNIEEFVFKNEDLTIRQQTWANSTSQSPENLEWAKEEPFSSDLDQMYVLTEYGNGPYGRFPDIRKMHEETVSCTGQTFILKERLIARNIPNTYSGGILNNEEDATHAYNWALTPEGVKSGGASGNSNGATIEPTNNVHVTDGMFAILVGEEYNHPLRQKLRVKTQYASTLSESLQEEVIKDILSENEEFAPAHILRMQTSGEITDMRFKSLLDQALFYQAVAWMHAENGDVSKTKRALDRMVRKMEDPILRTGWTIQTWANIKDLEMKSDLTIKMRTLTKDHPKTYDLLVKDQIKSLLNPPKQRDYRRAFR